MAGTTITIVATGAGRQRAARGPHKRAKEKPGQSRAKENRRLWGCLGLPHEAANGVEWTCELLETSPLAPLVLQAGERVLVAVSGGKDSLALWDLLRELDCDQAQGYHMGRPMPASDFGRWAASWEGRRSGSSSPESAGAQSSAVLH